MTESVGNMKLALDDKMDKEQDELDKRQIGASFLEVERGNMVLGSLSIFFTAHRRRRG